MAKISQLKALEILDSRGTPTLQVEVIFDNGISASAMVPSGASKGENEALELRDGDMKRFFGKGVLQAIKNVEGPLQKLLVGQPACDQERIDTLMIEADGTELKSRYGANSILGISLAYAKASALFSKLPLYAYLGG